MNEPLTTAASAPVLSDSGPASAGLWSSMVVTVLALAFVLALAWLFLRLLKRATTLRSVDGQPPWQIVQTVPLGGRERLVVMHRGEQEYVLGVTATGVQLIDKRPLKSGQIQANDSKIG